MRLGYWIVDGLDGGDAQGAAHLAKVHSQMNPAIRGTMYLPPYLRPSQCGIAKDSILFGCIDDVTGKGFAMYGEADADFQYFFDADIKIKKTLSVDDAVDFGKTLDVTDDISGAADVKAGSISLKNHTHPITAATYTGTIDPATGAAEGTISGNTEAPT